MRINIVKAIQKIRRKKERVDEVKIKSIYYTRKIVLQCEFVNYVKVKGCMKGLMPYQCLITSQAAIAEM